MPESYMEKIITWPPVDVAGTATRRETRIGKGDAGGNITWGEWRNISLTGLSGNQPPMEAVRNYHGRIIAAEVRDFNYANGSEVAHAETTMSDSVPSMVPGPTGVSKEAQPNNYVKVTLTWAPAVPWQLVVSRRIKINRLTTTGTFTDEHEIRDVAEVNKVIISQAQLSSSGYLGHKVVVSFIDNHGNESGTTETPFDLFADPEQPIRPSAPQFGGLAQVPGPEFGGQP